MEQKRNIIDLFCGCGGMSTGLAIDGFDIIAGVDNDSKVLRTFSRNHPRAISIEADLNDLKPSDLLASIKMRPGELDVLIGGPPCQGFSKNTPRKERFLEDPRNLLVRKFLDFVHEMRPKVVLMENVAEIVNGYEGSYSREILDFLEQHGYAVDVKVLFAPDFGVPQRRRRAFYFANRLGKPVIFPSPTTFPKGNALPLFAAPEYVTVEEAIGDLPKLRHGEGQTPTHYDKEPISDFQYWVREGSDSLYDHVARQLQDKQLARLSAIGPGQGSKDLPEDLRPKSHYSGAYGKLSPDMIAPTITRWVFHPGSGRFGHPYEDRVITIREAARLQSFPDTFVFEGTYIQKSHQVGNAVPPLLARAFAQPIKDVL